MKKQSLNGSWQFHQVGEPGWMPAQVPGGVHTDLLALDQIPDPFVADNELNVQWVAETDWEYEKRFMIDPGLMDEERIHLVCEGIDTIADIYLNEHHLGHTENMFRHWEWEVKPYLHTGENALRVVFGAPVSYIKARQAVLPLVGGGDIPGGPHLRKAPCHWGWDWGPKLPPIGFWKDVTLVGWSSAKFQDVHIRQAIVGGQARVFADLDVQAWHDLELMAFMRLTSPEGEVFVCEQTLQCTGENKCHFDELMVAVDDPQLWWPNGYGSQPLYLLEVWLQAGDTVLDTRQYQLGLRTIELRQEPDEWGKSFTFVVNGVPVFAKGADWIPADSFPTRLTASFLEQLIRDATLANMNMLRVWGGGYYPEDIFFDLCDRYGLLVWQDFMFACGIYPIEETFVENFRLEAIDNIRRLRHHASLALWCGNNEMEQGWVDWGWNIPAYPLNQQLKQGYDRIFHHLLPDVLSIEDPDHAYWPSSASSYRIFENPNGQDRGDCHYWDVWHGRKPFTAYRSQYPRFMSEFGFQALPPLKTIAAFAEPADWNMTSYIMEHHQRSGSGNGLMISQMTDTFRMPKDFPSLAYLSMVLQAEGIRYGVEHWRRNRNRVSGTLIWQLNDCWPVASWSSLDYFGRWKALHYSARRFYAPVLLSVEDTGKKMSIHVTSDLTHAWEGLVRWRLETLDGEVITQGDFPVQAAALKDTQVSAVDFSSFISHANQRQVVFVAELWGDLAGADRSLVSSCVTPFVANKHLDLKKPVITTQAHAEGSTLTITVQTSTLARFIELELEGSDVVFSDNYFDLPAGSVATITCALPGGWTLSKAQAALRARSLYDSFS
ncbi:MAG: glycoside hydrolase family 2 protein [Anaerolineales bacterium]|nr:glycoside hydrolase family 2 protein [Anaerolineales bacterium]